MMNDADLASVIYRPPLEPEQLRQLSGRSNIRAILGILRVYGLLTLMIGGAVVWGGWWIFPALVCIGALQHAISILQHEAVHGMLFRSHWWNEWVGNWVLSYPIGFSLDYRHTHFAHHRFLGTPQDPDYDNYRPFPASRTQVIQKIIREFCGLGAITQFLRKGPTASGGRAHLPRIILVQLIILGLFTAAGAPLFYFFLWLLPLITLTKGLAQFRNIAEHFIRPGAPQGTERFRTFRSSLLERFFLAPLNFHYHAEHHWYPTVPYYRLPALRRALRASPVYFQGAEWSKSYHEVLYRMVARLNTL